jgi:O-antigen/teichoic acid export membrane protein
VRRKEILMRAVLSQPVEERHKAPMGDSLSAMLAASMVSAVTGVILMFWVPRLVSVDDFGYWRSFLLYAGYAGFLHLGMVDGALLHWSRPLTLGFEQQRSGGRFGDALGTLILLHVVVAALGLGLLLTPLAGRHFFREMLIALLVYALLFNVCGLIQVRMQSRLRFSIVALGMAGPGVIFVVGLAALRLRAVTLNGLLLAFLLAWAVVTGVLFAALRSVRKKTGEAEAGLAVERRGLFGGSLAFISAGWPIMLANTGYGLMQSADRVTVNLSRPIHDFAVYSLSQSTIYVPITIIAAVSRVAFSHFAGVTEDGRARARQATVRGLTLLWMLLLPYYFVVEWVVRRYLPRYVPGLPAGKVLLLSVLFLSLISIVQATTSNLAGRQRRFLAGTLFALVLAFVSAWIGSRGIPGLWRGSLAAVAWSQVISAGIWWLWNEKAIASEGAPPAGEIFRVVIAFGAAAGGLYAASFWSGPGLVKVVLYYAAEVIPIFFIYRSEVRMLMQRGSRNAWSRA